MQLTPKCSRSTWQTDSLNHRPSPVSNIANKIPGIFRREPHYTSSTSTASCISDILAGFPAEWLHACLGNGFGHDPWVQET